MLSFIYFPGWLKPEIIPGLPLRWYGLMYIIAFGIVYFLFKYQIKKQKLEIIDDDIINFFFWAILGLLIGARLFAAFVYDPSGMYFKKPWLIFWPFDKNMHYIGIQGMSYHGGVIGVIVFTVVYCRVKKIDWFNWADMITSGIPLGYTFGRMGNFINGELWGRVTTKPWGMIFPDAPGFFAGKEWVREAAEAAGIKISSLDQFVNLPRHPSQLYEAFFEGIFLWLILWFIFRKRKTFNGYILGVYLIGYGIIRFIIEYFREPDAGIGFPIKLVNIDNPIYLFLTPLNFTTGQILCFSMIVGGGLLLFILRQKDKKKTAANNSKAKEKISYRKLRKKIK